MPLTLHAAIRLLSDHDLLSKVVRGTGLAQDIPDDPAADVRFSSITYDTRTVGDGSLLVRKGRFRPAYLDGLDERGLAAYVAETGYADHTDAPGLIAHDARKALSLLASEFYGRPQDELTIIGITGTKGKTTTAYLTHAILNADDPALHAVATVTVPGRMEIATMPDTRTTAIVDYAHNYTSIASLLDSVDGRYGDARRHPERHDIVLVIGKGHERWIKDRNRHGPYEGDDAVVSRLLSEPLE